MNPPYALVGPCDVVGFAFRTAVLDLSGTAGPSGPPGDARAMPASGRASTCRRRGCSSPRPGLEGIAVSAGVRDMWIGIGVHAGSPASSRPRSSTAAAANRHRAVRHRAAASTSPTPAPARRLLPEQTTLYVDAAGGIAPMTVRISVDGVVTTDDRVELTDPATGKRSITVTARDGAGHETSRTFTVSRRSAPVTGGEARDARQGDAAFRRPHAIVLDSQTTTTRGAAPDRRRRRTGRPARRRALSATPTCPSPPARGVDVTATLPAPAAQTIDAYFLFAQPDAVQPAPRTPNNCAVWTRTPALAAARGPQRPRLVHPS